MPVKIILLKTISWGMIKREQLAMEGNPQFGVQLQPIDFALYAQAWGDRVHRGGPKEIGNILLQAVTHSGPVVIQAVIDPLEAPLPRQITLHQALQFAKALARGQKNRWDILKTVVENKIREVI